MKFSQKMPLYLCYTMVQKSHKWPKTQIKGFCLNLCPGIKATCTRTRIFSKTELFDPGYKEMVTRIRTYPELFENARAPKRSFSKTLPKVDLSKTEVSDQDLFCVWTWYPDLFCHCFQGGQNWLAKAMNIASRAFAVSLPKPVAAHFFLFRKQNVGWLPLSSEATLPRRLLWRRLGVLFSFHFASSILCFILPLEPFFYHLPPRFTNYVPSFLGAQAREAIQKNDTGKQREQTKKALVLFELEASPSLSTNMSNTKVVIFGYRWRHFSWDRSTSVWTGYPDWRTIRMDTPKQIFSKTDFFENVNVCT